MSDLFWPMLYRNCEFLFRAFVLFTFISAFLTQLVKLIGGNIVATVSMSAERFYEEKRKFLVALGNTPETAEAEVVPKNKNEKLH